MATIGKEPWYVEHESGGCVAIKDDDNADVLIAGDGEYEVFRRIVACVNCLAGIGTEEIESGVLKNVLEKIAEEMQKYKQRKA